LFQSFCRHKKGLDGRIRSFLLEKTEEEIEEDQEKKAQYCQEGFDSPEKT
jgi:hypothetical protein